MGVTIKKSIVLLTGANRGIGKAILEQLIDQGATKVYACARNTDSLQPLIEGTINSSLGKYWRSKAFVFSFVPRSQGEWG